MVSTSLHASGKGEQSLLYTGSRHPDLPFRYLLNFPLALIAISIIIISVSYLISYFRSRRLIPRLSAQTLISGVGDSDLANLESDVILSSLASSLLPPHAEDRETPLPAKGAGKIVEDFKEDELEIKRWERMGWWVRLIGGVALLGVEVVRAVVEKEWKNVPFPVSIARPGTAKIIILIEVQAYLLLLIFIPSSPIPILLTFHLVPALLVLRTSIINPHTTIIAIAPAIVELLFWTAIISIPYAEPLDRLLDGSKSKGGGSSGSYGSELPRHLEEPTCTCIRPDDSRNIPDAFLAAFSRATFTFMIPFFFRYYWNPVTLKDIPAIREDDSASSSLGAFRADQAIRDSRYAEKHAGAKRKRNLGLDLIRFFSPEIFTQCVGLTSQLTKPVLM